MNEHMREGVGRPRGDFHKTTALAIAGEIGPGASCKRCRPNRPGVPPLPGEEPAAQELVATTDLSLRTRPSRSRLHAPGAPCNRSQMHPPAPGICQCNKDCPLYTQREYLV